jgi:hypothetical protein
MIAKRKEDKFLLIITLIVLLSGFYFLLPEKFPSTSLLYIFVIFFSIYFAALTEMQSNAVLRKICFTCSFLVLFFTLAFRNVSGIDDISYQRIFQEVQTGGVVSTFFSSHMEPGFLLLQYLIGVFTDDYIVAQAVNTFIPMMLFYMAFRKYRSFLSFPLAVSLFIALLYFQMLSTSLVRMFIAISIVFYSIDCLWKRQLLRYILRILLAASVHYSSLIMIAFLPFAFRQDVIQKHWKLFLLSGIILLPTLFFYIARIASMVGGRYEEYGEINNFTFSLDVLDTLPFAVIAWFYRKNIPDEYRNLFILSCVLILFSCIIELYSSMVSLGRNVFYMNLGLIIALPIGYRFVKSGISRWMIGIISFVYMLLYLYVTQFFHPFHSEYLFPYNNVFFRL